ncbi:MAG: sigma-70 family RNA polymerase sigma factor [Candidatus Eremiobacteraeota bacterium]|nr:sigma-70 family RNA polymerase sigma factor [Candidatus Eremiobacteraeota bacterium]
MQYDDESSLARAFAGRERAAFDEAYRRFGGLLYSTAMNVLHDPDDSQDCVHDVLTRIWSNPNAYVTQRGALRSFLVVCVRNDAISRQRSAKRSALLAQRLTAAPQTEEFEIEDFVQNAKLHDAIRQLPQEQRKPLLLAYFEHKTHVEVAKETQVPLGTTKSRLALALRKLGALLKPDYPA